MFIVQYEAVYGTAESFGTFNTVEAAKKWMKHDVEYNILNAEANGIKLVAEIRDNENAIHIEDFGDWRIEVLQKVEE